MTWIQAGWDRPPNSEASQHRPMPEGPSLVILREASRRCSRARRILRVEGNTTIDKDRLLGQRVEAVRSWGKHFLIETADVALRIHFLLFGSYRINERKAGKPRASAWASRTGATELLHLLGAARSKSRWTWCTTGAPT